MLHRERQSQVENPYNINAYKAEFAAANPIGEYIKDVEAKMPKFAGEEVTAESAPDGATSTDATGRPIIKRNGKWELQ